MEQQDKPLNHYQLQAISQKQKELKDAKYKERSRRRLANIIATKIRTTFIGSIAAVEAGLGFLWGHGKDPSELTEQELAILEIWEKEVRPRILDNGNGQLRGATNEINNHSVSWERFHLDIPVLQEDGESKINSENNKDE
jgi:hypothetical protein